VRPQTEEALVDILETTLSLYLRSFVKAYDSELSQDHVEYFYSEREWRMTNYLRFVPEDVQTIVVAPAYADEFAEAFPDYRQRIRMLCEQSG